MTGQIDNAIRVSLSGDKMTATLRIAAGTSTDDVNEMTIGSIVAARGVRTTDDVEKLIAGAVERYDAEADDDFEALIAKGIPPRHGDDGRFEYDEEVAEILDRAAKLKRRRLAEDETEEPAEAIEGDASHYLRSTLAVVKPGDRIGRVLPPTAGEDGVDVCGGCAAARHGSAPPITLDEATLSKAKDGSVTAKVGGLLDTADNRIRITEDLVIPGYVDFSTGNVEFDGDITVEKGVRDCFVVESAGTLNVVGQVEAAVLQSGRDTELHRGMTGREKGFITTGRDLKSKFIDAAELVVGRDLHIDRELTHCTTLVGRNILARNATILGGRCTVAGTAEFAQLGTESGTATVLQLGHIPEMERLLLQAAEIYPLLKKRERDARQELEQLQANTTKLTATQAESMTELQFVVMNSEAKMQPLRDCLENAIKLVQRATTCSVVIHRKVLPGTQLILGDRIATITDEIPGPITIELDDGGEPVILDRNSGSRTPLKNRATMDIDESVLDFEELKQQFDLAA